MDLNAIDPRATSPSASSRNQQSSNGGVFQGVMQMMVEIADRRTEAKSRDDSDDAPASHADRAAEPRTKETRTDERRDADDTEKTRTADTDTAGEDHGESPDAVAIADPATIVAAPPPVGDATQAAPAHASEIASTALETDDGVAIAASPETAAETAAGSGVGRSDAAGSPTGQLAAAPDARPDASAAQATPPQSIPPHGTGTDAAALRATPAQPVQSQAGSGPVPEQASALARDGASQARQPDAPNALTRAAGNGATQKAEPGAGRPDALMGAKVTVETPTPVARSQGVSSAVLVQAQQAAAAGQPQIQTSTANGGAGTLHVGGNQPTFVGADGNAAGGQTASGQNGNGQNGGAQNQGQNAGHNGQSNPQQIGAGFGATIGQRGFGGDASRAQFQQILATRTARPQPAALASGEAGRPMGGAGGSTSTTPLTMAGVGGPQSTHTSASPVNRAAATAHGRPGATLGTPADQVAVKLSATAKDGGGKITVRLNPEELGKVDIKMEISKDGHVRAVVSVERQETLDLLQRDAKALERALQDAGLQTDGNSLEFDLRGDNGRFADDTGDEAAPGKGAGPTPETDDGDAVADDQEGDPGSGGVKADGSLDMVA
ncbi:MAG: flagellar hook-length control protein FliK [Thalassobaculum sp.]